MTINIRAVWQTVDNVPMVYSGTIEPTGVPEWCRDRLMRYCENHQINADTTSYAAHLSDMGSQTDDDISIYWWHTDKLDTNRIVTGEYWPSTVRQVQTPSKCVIL